MKKRVEKVLLAALLARWRRMACVGAGNTLTQNPTRGTLHRQPSRRFPARTEEQQTQLTNLSSCRSCGCPHITHLAVGATACYRSLGHLWPLTCVHAQHHVGGQSHKHTGPVNTHWQQQLSADASSYMMISRGHDWAAAIQQTCFSGLLPHVRSVVEAASQP